MSYFTNVRYGKMRLVSRFKVESPDALRRRDHCIVRTDRGREIGEVLSPLEAVPESIPVESLWDVLRPAGPDDMKYVERMEKEGIPRAVKLAKEIIEKLRLPMKIVEVDQIFGGERIIFYFTSNARVDFRELVRQLAHEFRTRIDLKQVGARDQAKLLDVVGMCGLGTSCRTYLKELGGISMDMAKVQKHTSDPSKVTGLCGKLRCCLLFEYPDYVESRELLPARGARVESAKGTGFVISQNLLMREVTIQPDVGEAVVVKLDEIKGAAKPQVACNGCSEPQAAAAPAAETAPAPPPPRPPRGEAVWVPVGKVADYPPGKPAVVDLEGVKLAIFNVDGTIHVTANECGHQGGPLGEGKLEGGVVTCPWHQWKFEAATGKCLSVSGSSVRSYESRVIGEDLFAKV